MTLFYLPVLSATSQKAKPVPKAYVQTPFGQASVLTETHGQISTPFPF